MHINSRALSKEYQVTMRFKDHSRSLGLQYTNSIVSPFWPRVKGCSYNFCKVSGPLQIS